MPMDEAEVGWSNLNIDMLETIVEKVDAYTDYVRFRAVCFGWRSSVPDKRRYLIERFPCLLLSRPPSSTDDSISPCLINPLLPEVINKLQAELPQPFEALVIRGFSKGWLIALEKEGPSIYLINPFTKVNEIQQLPPVNTFPDFLQYHPDRVGKECLVRYDYVISNFSFKELNEFFINKIVLSSSEDFTAMAMHGILNQLVFCRPGDKGWTSVEERAVTYSDVVFHQGKFYAIDTFGCVVVCNLDSSPVAVRITLQNLPRRVASDKYYLVEWGNDLLVVARIQDWIGDEDNYCKTLGFEIFELKLNLLDSKSTSPYIELDNLGNHVLFLGENQSIALPSQDFPGCKANHIYFCDDYFDGLEEGIRGGSDIGVFDYYHKDLQRLPGYPHHPQFSFYPPPIWIMRNC